MQRAVAGAIKHNLISSAHDVADGGLFITLLEKGLRNNLGFDIMTDSEIRPDAYLFGEGQGRVVVSVKPDLVDDFVDFIAQGPVDITALGHVTQGKMLIDEEHFGFVEEAKEVYNTAIEKYLK